MARTRMLKPEFFRSRSLARVSRDARLTFQGLWCEADAKGRGLAITEILKGSIWPLDADITTDVIESHLAELALEHIDLYFDGEDRLYEIRNWEKHQSAAYRTGDGKFPSKADARPVVQLAQPIVQVASEPVQYGNEVVHKGKGREGKGRESVRQPNELWDALSDHFGEPVTSSEKSNRGRQVKELAAAGATAQDIHDRIREHTRRRENWTLTANALLTHWSELVPKPEKVAYLNGARMSPFFQG